MKNLSKRITAVLAFSAITLTSFSVALASEVNYEMITPVSSTKVTCDEYVTNLSGSGANTVNEGIVTDPEDDTNGKCFYLGDTVKESNNWSRGIAFGGDVLLKTNAGNRQVLAGVGKLTFDLYVSNKGGNISLSGLMMMDLKNRSGKKLGDIKFNNTSNGTLQVRAITRNYSNAVTSTQEVGDDQTRLSFNKWYSCVININVKQAKWEFEMADRDTGNVVLKFTFDNFGETTDNACAVEFQTSNEDRPSAYIDNWQFTREAFVIGNPTVVNNGNGYTATVVVQNETSTITAPPALILAVYDENGKLVEVNWDNTADVGTFKRAEDDYNAKFVLGTTTLTCSVGNGHTAKAFIWNNLSTLVPYITPVTPAAE